jgi:uncharacterized membrane protein (UPF0182 family)
MTLRLLLAALVLFAVLPSMADFYTDWLWFGEVGYRDVFVRTLTTQGVLGLAGFTVAFLLLFGNLQLALQRLVTPYIVVGGGGELRPFVMESRTLRRGVWLVAAVLSLGFGVLASRQWAIWLNFLYGVPFGRTDPLLGRDAGFYVFALPFYDFLRRTLLLLVLLALGGAAAIYGLAGVLRLTLRRGTVVGAQPRRHLALLAAAAFLLAAWGAWLDVPHLLLRPAGIIHGASYVDVYARIPALYLQAIVLLGGAALAVYHAFSSRWWPIPVAVGLYALVALGGVVYATLVQRIVVAPNEQVKEAPYIAYNIAATRAAFALEEVEERELSGDAVLTREDIDRNAPTLDNVRLWDHQPLLETFGQIQEIRTYYDFVSVDNDRYLIDGRYRQTMLSARELNSESLPNRTWLNERLVFTHGYGVALGPVNQVTQEGLPVLFIRDLPPQSSVDVKVDEPSLYFGELASDYVIVKTRTQEFHYPKGDDNVYASYAGEGGVPLGNFLRRALFSLRFRSFNILVSGQLTRESRILFYRRIGQRVRTIAPFLTYDRDPYLVIADGRLYWMVDAYTTSTRYPYATPASGGVNYIRNAVKVVVDAYHGRTTFYLADPTDPIVRTLQRIFPTLLRPLEDMPRALRQHVRYPEDLFAVQAAVYATYHMTNPAVFYNKEDQWEVPTLDREGRPVPMQPYYTIMRLPGEAEPEFIQMLPFTPRRKDNLAAWMVARSDGRHYGRLLVFQFPKQKVIFGPRQIVARINQDQVISPQITLWNQQGSEVIWGTLLVIPIEESLLYIRPLYLRAAGGRIPELKRVIVAHQNQIVMEETLAAALDRLFPRKAGAPAAPPAERPPIPTDEEAAGPDIDLARLAAEARAHYQNAMEALRAGDWSRYGDQIKRVGALLDQMSAPRRRNP